MAEKGFFDSALDAAGNAINSARTTAGAAAGSPRDRLIYVVTGIDDKTKKPKPFGNDRDTAGRFADEALRNQKALKTSGGRSLTDGEQQAMAVRMAEVWKAHPGSIDRFAASLNSPGSRELSARYHQLNAIDAGRAYATFAADPSKAAAAINTLWLKDTPQGQAEAKRRADAAAEQTAQSAATKGREQPTEQRGGATRPSTRSAGTAAPATADKVAPIVAASGAGASATVPDSEIASMDGIEGSKVQFSSGMVAGFADEIAGKLNQLYPDMKTDIEGFRTKLKKDERLQARIAENLNNNPDFVEQLKKLAASNDPEHDGLLKRYGRSTIQDLVTHPEKLADDKYVDGLSSTMSGAGGGGFSLAGIMDTLKNIDWGGMLHKCGEWLKAAGAKLGEILTNVCGGGNTISTSNRPDSMYANVQRRGYEVNFSNGQDIVTNDTRVHPETGATSERTVTVNATGVTTRDQEGKIIGGPAPTQPTPANQPALASASGPVPAGGNPSPPTAMGGLTG